MMKQPDYNVRVEVRMDGVYVFTQIYEGVLVVYQLALAVNTLNVVRRHRPPVADGNYETWCLYRSDSFP